MRHRQDVSNKMRWMPGFWTESWWVVCPIDIVCTLQYTATHSNTLQHTAILMGSLSYWYSMYAAAYCNTLQHTATLMGSLFYWYSMSIGQTAQLGVTWPGDPIVRGRLVERWRLMCESTNCFIQLSWACTQFVRKSWITSTVHFARNAWKRPRKVQGQKMWASSFHILSMFPDQSKPTERPHQYPRKSIHFPQVTAQNLLSSIRGLNKEDEWIDELINLWPACTCSVFVCLTGAIYRERKRMRGNRWNSVLF